MGLDMYLCRKIHIGAQYEFNEIKGDFNIYKAGKKLPLELVDIRDVVQEVGYWRKANQIHKWFVDNVQDGKDDCADYWVSEEDLEKLLNICKTIKEKCPLVVGKVINGKRFNKETEEWEEIIEDGKIMTNTEIAKELLPSQEGFFFGSTNYDQYYYEDILDTIKILENVILKNKDFKEAGFYPSIYYHSSW